MTGDVFCVSKLSHRRPRSAGFTLIELLVVLAIVGLLLSVALPRYLGSLDRSKEVALQENLRVMRVSIDKFHADKGKLPESLEQLVSNQYLRQVPVDPMTDSSATWIVISSRGEESGVADVKSGAGGVDKSGKSFETY